MSEGRRARTGWSECREEREKEGKEEGKERMTSENKDADKWTEKERNLVRGTNGMAVKKRNEKKGRSNERRKEKKKTVTTERSES